VKTTRGAGPSRAQAARQFEAVQAGHLDVEEDHVGRQFVDQAQGLDAVRRAADDLQFRPGDGELLFEIGQQVRFVVGEQGSGHAGSRGSSRREVTPAG
jgi:hypothetical protein